MASSARNGSDDRPMTRQNRATWPRWLQATASVAIALHLAAIVTAALAAGPSSTLQKRIASYFFRYNDLVNQGYGYRFYSRLDSTVDPLHPHPWGTPVITAEMKFAASDGRESVESLRLPEKDGSWPRLRHQRQLDLAYHLSADPRWAASYARHLMKTRGCKTVAIYTQEHTIPDLRKARSAAGQGAWRSIELDDAATYTPRVSLGEFRCDDF